MRPAWKHEFRLISTAARTRDTEPSPRMSDIPQVSFASVRGSPGVRLPGCGILLRPCWDRAMFMSALAPQRQTELSGWDRDSRKSVLSDPSQRRFASPRMS